MRKAESFVGFTDIGQPLVLAEGSCEYFLAGKRGLLAAQTCWYCRYADFRKTVEIELAHSVCRCPRNQVCILTKNETVYNEEEQGGYHHV